MTNLYHILTEGLSIDYKNRRIWWVNRGPETPTVMSCDLDGHDPRTLTLASTMPTPHVIAVYEGKVYFASGDQKASMWVTKYDGTNTSLLRMNTPSVNAMKIFIKDQLNGTWLVDHYINLI